MIGPFAQVVLAVIVGLGFSGTKEQMMKDAEAFSAARVAFEARIKANHPHAKGAAISPESPTLPPYSELKTGDFMAFQASQDRAVVHHAFVDGQGTVADLTPKQRDAITKALGKATPTTMESALAPLFKAMGVGTDAALGSKALKARIEFLISPLKLRQLCPTLPEGGGFALRAKVLLPAKSEPGVTSRAQTGWLGFLVAADGTTRIEAVSDQGRSGCRE